MASEQEIVQGDPNRAIQALERAIACSEQGNQEHPVVLARPEDLRAVSSRDLRTRLDRMMLAPHPDEGLEALLNASVLDTLFPEVKSMVGFGDGEWRHKDV